MHNKMSNWWVSIRIRLCPIPRSFDMFGPWKSWKKSISNIRWQYRWRSLRSCHRRMCCQNMLRLSRNFCALSAWWWSTTLCVAQSAKAFSVRAVCRHGWPRATIVPSVRSLLSRAKSHAKSCRCSTFPSFNVHTCVARCSSTSTGRSTSASASRLHRIQRSVASASWKSRIWKEAWPRIYEHNVTVIFLNALTVTLTFTRCTSIELHWGRDGDTSARETWRNWCHCNEGSNNWRSSHSHLTSWRKIWEWLRCMGSRRKRSPRLRIKLLYISRWVQICTNLPI